MDLKRLLRIRDWRMTGNYEWRVIKRAGRVALVRLYYEQVDLNSGDHQVTRWIRGSRHPEHPVSHDEWVLPNYPEHAPDRFKNLHESWFSCPHSQG